MTRRRPRPTQAKARRAPRSERKTRRIRHVPGAPPVCIELIGATASPDLIAVPGRVALAIDGEGSPASPAFASALGALYGVAFTLKFARARSGRDSFAIGTLESRWWAVGDHGPGVPPKDAWRWRLRLAIPADVEPIELELAKATAIARKGGKLAGSQIVPRVFLELIAPQRLGRILHVGSYASEPASLAKLDAMLVAAGATPSRSHLEIYLNDPRRTASSKLRTVLLRELEEK